MFVIDEYEGRKVATMDITSDFLHTAMESKDPKVHMELWRKLAELMVKVDPKL